MKRLAVTLLCTVAATAAGAARPKGPPTATPNGKAIDCVRLLDVRETRVRDDSTIDFIMTDRRVYRNVLPIACPQLGFEESFTYRTSIEQLCSVDTITVLYHDGALHQGATCGLGSFQPVTLAG